MKNKRAIPYSFLISLIFIIIIEVFIVRAIYFKQFLIHWCNYSENQAWVRESRTKSDINYLRAKKQINNGILTVGSSDITGVIEHSLKNQKNINNIFFDLSTSLASGMDILLNLCKSISLPQKKIILCISEFSFYFSSEKIPIEDLFHYNAFKVFIKLFIKNPEIRKTSIFMEIPKGFINYMYNTLRYSKDIRWAFSNYIDYFINKKSQIFLKSKESNTPRNLAIDFQLNEVNRLTLSDMQLKILILNELLNNIKKSEKEIKVIIMPIHSELRNNISKQILKNFKDTMDHFRNQYSLTIINIQDEAKIQDEDFSDYIHLNENGSEKAMMFITKKLEWKK